MVKSVALTDKADEALEEIMKLNTITPDKSAVVEHALVDLHLKLKKAQR